MAEDLQNDERFMKEALKEAKRAFESGEIPVGAVITCNNLIIARAHNFTERLNDVTAHAEMQAFTSAADYLGGKYLGDCTLYVTLEPCVMCAGASFWTQIGRIVFGASDPKRGFMLSGGKKLLHPKTLVRGGVLADVGSELIKLFFEQKRREQ